ncbi:EAL domain-containing protein [Haliea sp. E1-2-M8]|uniref:sensor domain-containing protein n=1 Tax=Haliea sp. E1-2-M8 TaxID=3064706 RepID=UPI00271BB529|nr:EAL domain-containing protein [Haliea sp. E1-2-M8]MDO8862272.1 EAL domain-containing protein [Haliea sp. E1-2-M8]
MSPAQIFRATSRVTLIYFFIGALWILLSDRALLLLLPEGTGADISALQTWKGWIFIVLTSLLLSLLVRRALQRQSAIQTQLDKTQLDYLQRLAHLEVGIYETGTDGKVSYANHAATQLAGLRPGDNRGDSYFQQLPSPQHRERVQDRWQAALTEHISFLERYPLQSNAKGAMRWLVDSAYPRYRDGVFCGHEGTLTDISGLHEAHEYQQTLEHRLQLTLAASPTITYTMDVRGEVYSLVWVSDNVERILKVDAAVIVGSDWWQQHIHPDDIPVVLGLMDQLREGQQSEVSNLLRVTDGEGELRWIRNTSRCFALPAGDTGSVHIVGCWVDITESKQDQERRDLHAAAIAGLSEGVLIVDQDHIVLSCNAAFAAICGRQEAELAGHSMDQLFGNGTNSSFRDVMDMLDRTPHWHGEIFYHHPGGREIPLTVTASVVHSTATDSHKRVLICRDISLEKRFEEDLVHLAHYDALTNLPNRLLLVSRLEHAIERARRKQQQLAVLFLDLDDFKTLNDSYGHVIGDEVLVEVARRLQHGLRRSDTLARLGGDEFVCLMEDMDSSAAVAQKASDLIASVTSQYTLSNGRECFPECCIGISVFPENGDTWEELLRSADTAMYRAKSLGNSRFCFFTEDLGISAVERMDTITQLRLGMEKGELLLHYQPQVSMENELVTSAEALVRWDQPGNGLVPPARFIPLAESSGLINAIGAWVIDEAGRQVRCWRDEGLEPVQICINVAARQFQDQNLVSLMQDMLLKYDLSAADFGLEITESALMAHPQEVVRTLGELHAMGLRIALDDFGTGFCSFAYLTSMPIDVLKIDKQFVDDINCSEKGNQIVHAMLELATILGMTSIAEGVETQAQSDFLRSSGCDLFQGYLFARPMPAAEFREMLQPRR